MREVNIGGVLSLQNSIDGVMGSGRLLYTGTNVTGENLLRNGKPYLSYEYGQGGGGSDLGWSFSRQVAGTTCGMIENEYFYTTVPASASKTVEHIFQFTKYAVYNGNPYARGVELESLRVGVPLTFSMEYKNNCPATIGYFLVKTFSNGISTKRAFRVTSDEPAHNDWTKVQVTFSLPDDWFSDDDAYLSHYRLVIQVSYPANSIAISDDATCYIRNIKLEYGNSATPFSYSTVDVDYLFTELNGRPYIPFPPTTNGTYTLKATVANGVTTYNWT